MADDPEGTPEVKFRTYGQVPCLVYLALVGLLVQLLSGTLLSEVACVWLYTIVLWITIMMIVIDTDAVATALIGSIVTIIVLGGMLVEIPLLSELVDFLASYEAAANIGYVGVTTFYLFTLIFFVWAIEHIYIYEFSGNTLEYERLILPTKAQGRWTLNTFGLTLEASFPNFLKWLLLGMGDILIKRDNNVLQTVNDVPMLAWGLWKRIDPLNEQLNVRVVAPRAHAPH